MVYVKRVAENYVFDFQGRDSRILSKSDVDILRRSYEEV